MISYICEKHDTIMSFNNFEKLRVHVLKYHEIDIRSKIFKNRFRDVNDCQHARKHVYNFTLSSFTNYAKIKISIFDTNFTSCLNINENVSLCDRSFLSSYENQYDLIHNIKSITIINVTKKQILNQYIEQQILLNFNKIFVQIKIYLIDNLKSNLIIDINVLNKENMNLMFTRQILKMKDIEISLYYILSSKRHITIYQSYHFMINALNFNKKHAHFSKNVQSSKFYDLKTHNAIKSFYQKSHKCRKCKQHFNSRNLLHEHLTHYKKSIKNFKRVAMNES